LCVAAYNGHLEVVKLLLEKGADIEHKDNDGRTPLCVAAYNGHLEVVRLLLEKGADIEHKDNDGRIPFSLASRDIIEDCIDIMNSEVIRCC
jgi:ankyrin repeat protein